MFSTHGIQMFTQTLARRVLGSPLVDLLTGPHGVDRYTELLAPTLTLGGAAPGWWPSAGGRRAA